MLQEEPKLAGDLPGLIMCLCLQALLNMRSEAKFTHQRNPDPALSLRASIHCVPRPQQRNCMGKHKHASCPGELANSKADELGNWACKLNVGVCQVDFPCKPNFEKVFCFESPYQM